MTPDTDRHGSTSRRRRAPTLLVLLLLLLVGLGGWLHRTRRVTPPAADLPPATGSAATPGAGPGAPAPARPARAPGHRPIADLGLLRKVRQYHIVPVRPAGVREVRYRFDDEADRPLRRGNLLEIRYVQSRETAGEEQLERVRSNHFIEDDFAPSNPKVPFRSNAPYYIAEVYSSDDGGIVLLKFYRLEGGAYDWDTPPGKACGALVVRWFVPPGRPPRGPVTHTLALYDSFPPGRELGWQRRDDIGRVIERAGKDLGDLRGEQTRLVGQAVALLHQRRTR